MTIDDKEDYGPAGDGITVSPGEMITALRRLKGWTRQQLARATGIAQATLVAIETGGVELDKTQAIALAEALHVHPASILFADYEAVA